MDMRHEPATSVRCEGELAPPLCTSGGGPRSPPSISAATGGAADLRRGRPPHRRPRRTAAWPGQGGAGSASGHGGDQCLSASSITSLPSAVLLVGLPHVPLAVLDAAAVGVEAEQEQVVELLDDAAVAVEVAAVAIGDGLVAGDQHRPVAALVGPGHG